MPVITNKTNVSFDVQLDKPGDFYEFTVDVKNNGSIDEMVDSITKTSLNSSQSVYLDYVVTGLNEKSLLIAGKLKKVNVKVIFKDIDST